MKGSFYSLEAAIAVAMIIVTIVLFFQTPQTPVELSKANYKVRIYDALEISDEVGNLRNMVLDNNATGIENEIGTYVQAYLNYNVTIYNKTGNLTAVPTLDSENILTVSYFLAGTVGNYTPREVRVFIWGID
jgi:hypothetical protein